MGLYHHDRFFIRSGSDIHRVGDLIRTSARGTVRVVKVIPHFGYCDYEVEPFRDRFGIWSKVKAKAAATAAAAAKMVKVAKTAGAVKAKR